MPRAESDRRSGAVDPFELRKAFEVVTRFRAKWAQAPQPLAKVAMGLRSMAQAVTGKSPVVSQRLKRLDRIIEKLLRPEHQTMRLPQMEDIGGCRVVVPTLDELWRLHGRVVSNWVGDLRQGHDYIGTPKADGYRAVHLIVERDGHLVEVQLRTRRQHLWAAQVERLEMTRRETLRGGEGTPATQEALRGVSEVLALADAGVEIPEVLVTVLETWLQELADGA